MVSLILTQLTTCPTSCVSSLSDCSLFLSFSCTIYIYASRRCFHQDNMKQDCDPAFVSSLLKLATSPALPQERHKHHLANMCCTSHVETLTGSKIAYCSKLQTTEARRRHFVSRECLLVWLICAHTLSCLLKLCECSKDLVHLVHFQYRFFHIQQQKGSSNGTSQVVCRVTIHQTMKRRTPVS